MVRKLITITPQQNRQLVEESKKTELAQSDIVRRALEHYFNVKKQIESNKLNVN